jgi:CCR4-NOT transcription complex subunit 2
MGQMPFMTGGAASGTQGNGSTKATDLKANEDQWAAQLALVKQQVAQALKEERGKGKVAAAPASTTAAAAASTSNKFGLMGLLDVIRMTDRDLNSLMLGSDLTTYGLNLNSDDSLYSSFCSPFADQVASAEPKFATPQCYLMNPPNLKMEHMRKFQLETLFYMFYALPQDVLQAHSAQELMRREWRYHGELKIWLKQRMPQEVMATSGADGQAPVAFIFFDANSWEARPFNAVGRGTLHQGFLSEDDIKFSA